jgi:hypothetical protein
VTLATHNASEWNSKDISLAISIFSNACSVESVEWIMKTASYSSPRTLHSQMLIVLSTRFHRLGGVGAHFLSKYSPTSPETSFAAYKKRLNHDCNTLIRSWKDTPEIRIQQPQLTD